MRIFACFIFLLALFPAYAAPVQVGAKSIEIPTPPGYGRVTPEMGKVLTLLQQMTAPTNNSLALFIREEELPDALAGEIPGMERRFVVQVPKAAIGVTVTNADFVSLKQKSHSDLEKTYASVRERMPNLMEKASGEVSETLGIDMMMEIGGIVPLPVHHEDERSVAMSTLVRYDVEAEGGVRIQEVVAGTTTIIHVKDSLLFLFVYGTKDDLAWTREQSKAWTRAIMAANGQMSQRDAIMKNLRP